MMKHLVILFTTALLLVACNAGTAGPVLPLAPDNWQELPALLDAAAIDGTLPNTAFAYETYDEMETVEEFLVDEMTAREWELLGIGDTGVGDQIAESIWLAKGESVVTIQLWQTAYTTRISVIPQP